MLFVNTIAAPLLAFLCRLGMAAQSLSPTDRTAQFPGIRAQ
jgi:hypothetical protein